jgi:hypothetical protein
LNDTQRQEDRTVTATAKQLTATIEGGYLVIRAPLNATPTPSTSGKTLVVASSRGNKETEVQVEGRPVYVGVNAYIYHG